MKSGKGILFSLLLSAAAAFGQSTILWDESVNGLISNASATPTPLPLLQVGTNTVIGATEIEPSGGIWIAHHDFFTLNVPSDTAISAVYLQINKPNVWHWIGSATFDTELAFIMNPTSGELLSQWELNSIWLGHYGIYVGNADAQAVISVANYRLDFVVVPEPATLWLLLGGLGWLGFRSWRNSRLKI